MPPKGTKKNKITPSTSTDIINFNRAKKVANTRSTKKNLYYRLLLHRAQDRHHRTQSDNQ